MNRVEVLCDNNKEMMLEFSRLCISRLTHHLPLRVFLSLFRHFLDANVLKEIEKDRLVIEYAAAAFEEGKHRADIDVNVIFEKTRHVDSEFVKKVSVPPLSIEIRYEDFAEIRKRRILSLVSAVYELFSNWQEETPFGGVVKRTFTEERFKEVIEEILHLYSLETKLLNNSINFHGPAGKVKDLFAEKLYSAMEKTGRDIAVQYTRKVYTENVCSCASPT